MPRVDLPIIGGYYKDPNLHWSAQDCLNWLVQPGEKQGTRTRGQLVAFGRRPWIEFGNGAVRGLRNVEGRLFAVAGNQLYDIRTTGVAIPRGTVPGVGRVSMSHNQRGLGNELLVVNGSAGYVYNTQTQDFGKITDDGYPGAIVADYVDSYLAQVEPQGRYWFHSDLADAYSYNTLDQYEAEGLPDRIVSLIVSHREVLVFGKETVEPYVNTGGETGTFERASNTVIECGCSAKFTPRKLDNSVFWLDDKRIVRRLDGYTPVRISVGGIEAALSECTAAEISQAWATTFEDRGHKLYILTVPGRFTFAYDVWSQEWVRLATNGLPHWAITDLVYWNGQWIAGDSRSGKLYVLDWDYMRDGDEELIRERVTPVLADRQSRICVNSVELLFGVGGIATSVPTDAGSWVPILSQYPNTYVDPWEWDVTLDSESVMRFVSVATYDDDRFPYLGTVAPEGTPIRFTSVEYGVGMSAQVLREADPDTSMGPLYPEEGEVSEFEIPDEMGGQSRMYFRYAEDAEPLTAAWLIEIQIEETVFVAPDRKVQICVSKDGGHNWSDWREASLGEVGEYRKRVRFNRFGQSPQWLMKVRVTSPVKADLMGAVADFEVGD